MNTTLQDQANALLKTLTLEEKVALVTGHGSWHTKAFGGKIPYVTMSDGPHGLRKQDEEHYTDVHVSNPATCFPTGSALASGWDLANTVAVSKAIAAEAKSERVSVVLGPAVNIKRNPLCGRNFEYYSEDPYLAGTIATAYVKAMEEEGIGTSLKHFACNSQETRRQTSNSIVDERTLHEIYLRAFEMCVKDAQPSTIMASYNRINNHYSCANKELLTNWLRDRWGYDGTVISDWGATMNLPECLKAGLDLEMPDSYGYHTHDLLDDVKSGQISEEELNRSCLQVLKLAIRRPTPEEAIPCDLDASHELSKKVSSECAVLLRHEGAFPIRKEEKVLLVGRMAAKIRFQGGGSSHITTRFCKNVIESLSELGYSADYQETIAPILKTNFAALEAYDQVIFFGGLTDTIESEGYDRKDLKFPADQLAELNLLCEHHSKVSVVTFGGAPFEMPFLSNVKDVLHMHLGGEAVGEAVALLITGAVNPSGHLSETWPLDLDDVPSQPTFGKYTNNVAYKEGVLVGYRYYETMHKPVQFPFGFGLSYTSFAYSGLSLKKTADGRYQATYTITNTGSIPGAEVSQIYIHNPKSEWMRSSVELVGFSKDYLQPGESKTICVLLDDHLGMVYHPTTKQFETIAGDYVISVGSHVQDAALSAPLALDGFSATDIPLEPVFLEQPRDFDADEPGEYTVYHSMECVCSAFGFGRFLLRLLTKVVPLFLHSTKDDPATKMIMSGLYESPIDSLVSMANGTMKPNMAEFLVLCANKHPWRGIKRFFSRNRRMKYPYKL